MAKRIYKVNIDEFKNLASHKGSIIKGNKYKCIRDITFIHNNKAIAKLKKDEMYDCYEDNYLYVKGGTLGIPSDCQKYFELVNDNLPKADFDTIDEIIKDNVNHPSHYTSHPSGIECITITQHHDFCIGNAIKYLWRAGLKKDADKSDIEKEIEDLEKARWYINQKIRLLCQK